MRVLAAILLACCAEAGVAQDFSHTPKPPVDTARAEANAALDARDYPRALKLLAPLAAANPADARLWYDLGSTQDALDQTSPAEASYRTAIIDDPTLAEPRVALGLLFARAGRMADARSSLAAAAALETADKLLRARAFRALARIDERSRPADARDELLAALKLSPETPDDTLLAAELAEGEGSSTADAEAAYRRVLVQRPNDPEAAAALAHLLLQGKRPADAEALLSPALAAHPVDPALIVQLASTYAAQGKTAQALPLVERLHSGNPGDANVAHLLGRLYLDAGRYSDAEPLLSSLSLRKPADGELADERADALIHLKRFSEAQQILQRVVAQPNLFPSGDALGNAAGHLAFAASENNDPAASLRALDVRATVLPPSAPVLFLAAISHDKLHQVKLAQQAYKQFLLASNGENPDEEFEAQHRLVALDHMK